MAPCGQADALFEAVEHGSQRGAVLGIAGEHLMSDREAVAIDDQADHHLLAVRAVVARIAALRFGIGRGLAFEVDRGQVVEVDHAVEVEQVALALDQCGFDGGAMGVELVEDAVERILCQGIEPGAEDVGQCRAADPLRRRMLGSGLDQPVQNHRAGEPARAAGDPEFAQDLAQAETVPELVADMDRTGFAMVLGGDPTRVDGDVLTLRSGRPAGGWRAVGLAERNRGGGDLWRRQERCRIGGRRLAGAGFCDKTVERRVARPQQVGLSSQGVFEFAGEREPFLVRSGLEVAKRADGLLARSRGRLHGLDEDIIGVGLALIGARRTADVHAHYPCMQSFPGQ